MLSRFIVVLLSLSIFKPSLYAQNQESMVGTDFWLGFMDNRLLPFLGNQPVDGPCFLSLHISAKEATTGMVSIVNAGWSIPFTVQASSTVIVDVPEHLARHVDFNSIQNKAIHVESKNNVSVVAFNRIAYSADATSVLPIEYLGNDYMLNTYNAISAEALGYSEFLVVATADSTIVEITPKTSLLGGYSSGSTYSVVLNKGESYQNRASNVYTDLTGTVIKGASSNGTCKPFAVFVGSQGTYIPAGCSAGDHLFDQSIPTSEWGDEYYLASFAHTGYYGYRVTARYNGTVVTTNVTGTNTLNAGQSLFIHTISSPRRIISNLPIQVSKIMMGIDCTSNVFGDPAIMSINSKDQTLKEAFFTPLDTDVIDTHYLEINVATVHKSTIYLDDVLVPDSLFQPIGFYPEMSLAYIPVSPSLHHVQSIHGFHAYSYGVGQAESYVLNLGYHKNTDEIFISQTSCMSGAGQITASPNITDVWWSSFSEPEDTIGSGPTLIIPAPVQNDIYISHGISVSTGCPTISYRDVQSSTPPNISMSVSKDTVCSLSEITLSLQSDQSVVTAEITWFPDDLITSANGTEATAYVVESGWYGVTFESGSPLFCYSVSDSVYVEVSSNSPPISGSILTEANLLCFGESTDLHVDFLSIWEVDLFNDSINGNMWSNVLGGSISSNCESFSGSSVQMNGGVDRVLESQAIDFSSGGEISFYLYTGNSVFPCDQTDNNEDVELQYSLDNGATWIVFKTLYEYNYHTLSKVEVDIPIVAQTAGTKLRLIQPTFSAQDEDIWTVDNFEVYLNTTPTAINWTSSGNILNSNSLNPTIYTDSSAWYYVSVGDPFCGFKDSIFINADNFNVTVSLDSNSCIDRLLNATPNDSDEYCYAWSTGQWSEFSDSSSIQISSELSGSYSVSVISEEGCVFQDTVQVVPYSFFTTFSGDLSGGCIGVGQTVTAHTLSWIGDDFNADTVNLSLWDSIFGGELNNYCGAITENTLHFGGEINARAVTLPLNVEDGGVIQFYLTHGGGSPNCNNAGVTVRLYYSVDNGVTWTSFEYFPSSSTYQYYEIEIPLGAQTSATRFKWEQTGTSLSGVGNWALDNLKINTTMPSMSYTWTDENNTVISNSSTVSYTPDSTTYLYLEAFNSSNGCSQHDSILISAGADFDLELNDTTFCSFGGVNLSVPYSLNDGYTFTWWTESLYAGSGSTDSVINFVAISLYNDYADSFAVEVTSIEGCVRRDTAVVTYYVFDDFGIAFDSTKNLCVGTPLSVSGQLYTKIFDYDFELYLYSPSDFFEIYTGQGLGSGGGLLVDCAINPTDLNTGVGYFTNAWGSITSYNYDFSSGGLVEFSFNYGDNSGGGTCDAPEIGEEVVIEYSIDNGNSWVLIRKLEIVDFTTWKEVCIPIPPAAQTNQVRLRWRQLSSSNLPDTDTWMIDNVKFYNYSAWLPSNYEWALDGTIISTDSALSIPAIQGSNLTLIMSDTLGVCMNYVDTIHFSSFSVDLPSDTMMCDVLGFQVDGSVSVTGPYIASWNIPNVSPSDSISTTVGSGLPPDSTLPIILEIYQQGCTFSDTMIVSSFPSPVNTIASQDTICNGTSVPIDLTGATNILWSPDNTVLNSALTNPILMPFDDEQYLLTYNAGGNNCSYSHTIQIDVVHSPMLVLPDSLGYCVNDSVGVIPIVFSTVNDHIWSTGDSTAVIFAQTSGTYYLTESNFCGAMSDSVFISEAIQTLNLVSQAEICQGSSVLIDMTGASNIVWTPSNSVINAWTTSPELAPQANEQYTVSFIDPNTCEYVHDISVNVNSSPTTILPDSLEFCEYDSVLITPTIYTASDDFAWNTGDTTVSIYAHASGLYELTTSNGCGTDFDTILINQITLNPTVSQNVNALTTDVIWDSYQWIDCSDSSILMGESQQTLNTQSSGSYAVIVESGMCIDTSDCQYLDWVELLENENAIEINVYPNPFDDFTTVSITGVNTDSYFVTLEDMTGRIVLKRYISGSKTFLIKKENLQSGLYHLRLMKEGSFYFKSIPVVIK